MSTASTGTGQLGDPVDFRVTLPQGWARLPLDERASAAVMLLVKDASSRAPVEHQESLRQLLTRSLNDSVAQGRRAGGIDVMLSVEPLNGVPVPASCLVAYVESEPGAEGTDGVESLATQLAAIGYDISIRDLDAGVAVRRAGTRVESLDSVTHDPRDAMIPLVVTEVSYWFRVPGRPGFLSLNFSTVVAELGEALTMLFDAIAETFWWVTA